VRGVEACTRREKMPETEFRCDDTARRELTPAPGKDKATQEPFSSNTLDITRKPWPSAPRTPTRTVHPSR